jgi:hypothetical protein
MAVSNVLDAAEAVRSSNGRLNSSALRSSSPRLRRPRGNGRDAAAGVDAAAIAAKNRLRIRTLPLRNSSSHARRANRVLLVRRKPRVRMLRERRRRVRKAMVRNGAAVFVVAGVAAVAADRKALRPRRSYASSVTISMSTVPPIWNSDLS